MIEKNIFLKLYGKIIAREMSGYRRVNYYELCRLCTSSEGPRINIFREEGRQKSLQSKIETLLPFRVSLKKIQNKRIVFFYRYLIFIYPIFYCRIVNRLKRRIPYQKLSVTNVLVN